MKNKLTTNCLVPLKDPFELLCFYVDDIREGRVILYDWQIERLKLFGRDRGSIDDKIHEAVVANNGSGKSQFILAPCIVWLPMMFDFGLSYVTSSSAYQLDTQTERYIDYLIDSINSKHLEVMGQPCWKRVKRSKTCFLTQGVIDLVATDEAGKVEGKHPLKPGFVGQPPSEFAVIVDEGKSIDPAIYKGLERCTGYSRKLYASSPGDMIGEFYDVCSRRELNWNVRRVIWSDCPRHISKTEVEQAIIKYGLYDPWVRSAYFAEFTSVGSKNIVTLETLNFIRRLYEIHLQDGTLEKLRLRIGPHDGLDLAAGGDEVVFSMWDDNFQTGQETCRFSNTLNVAKEVIHWFQKYKRDPIKCNADDGGIGRGIIDVLHERGYMVRRCLNNYRAYDNTRYLNRGVETWFNVKRFLEECAAFPVNDPALNSQLTNRYYFRSEINQKLRLESKEQAKANGHPSPDRADAMVLAWADFEFPISPEQLLGYVKPAPDPLEGEKIILDLDAHYRGLRRKQLGVIDIDSTEVDNGEGFNRVLTQTDLVENMLRYDNYLRGGKKRVNRDLVFNNKEL